MIPIPAEAHARALRTLLAPVAPYLDDPTVSEVMINGPGALWIERAGRVEAAEGAFFDDEALMAAARGIAQYVDRDIGPHAPRLDARLPDGSRVHVIVPPAVRGGPHVSIRKFSNKRLSLAQLVSGGSLTAEAAEFLGACVRTHQNIIVAGGTGSGKTSLLNVLSGLVDPAERIIVIEDSSELQLQQPHVVYLEARPPDVRGRGRITIQELFWSSMRLRPDRIVIGELRGAEALDLVQAMTSGHGGSMSTTHATHPHDTLRRLETMALMSDVALPHAALREQVASAVQIIVQTSRFNDGGRGITHISEVLGLDDGGYRVADVFVRGVLGRDRGRLVRTAHTPRALAHG